MKEINRHCSDLSKLVSGWESEIEWPNLCEWLHVASGITDVKFNVTQFDDGFGWCRDADEFSMAREDILQRYITELTRFTYIWSALESLITHINPQESPEKGKINNICFFMKNKLSPSDKISPYQKLMEKLHNLLSKQVVNEQQILNRFKGNLYLSEHGLDIYVIYKLRNLFLHGALNFPYPDEENQPNSLYPELVNISSRITLITIQIILLAYYINSDEKTICHWDGNYETELPVKQAIRSIHLEVHEENIKQLKIC